MGEHLTRCAVWRFGRLVQPGTHHQTEVLTGQATGQMANKHVYGGVPCVVHALCEKLAVLHHREFGKFRRLKGRH